jgi:hypothetical protein
VKGGNDEGDRDREEEEDLIKGSRSIFGINLPVLVDVEQTLRRRDGQCQ